jgi:hypothetical protein
MASRWGGTQCDLGGPADEVGGRIVNHEAHASQGSTLANRDHSDFAVSSDLLFGF